MFSVVLEVHLLFTSKSGTRFLVVEFRRRLIKLLLEIWRNKLVLTVLSVKKGMTLLRRRLLAETSS